MQADDDPLLLMAPSHRLDRLGVLLRDWHLIDTLSAVLLLYLSPHLLELISSNHLI